MFFNDLILIIKRFSPKSPFDQSQSQKGFSIVEAMLTSALMTLVVSVVVGALIYGQESTALSGRRARATFLAEEGQEAARNIRDENFASLTDGTHGLAIVGNQWLFSGTQDVIDSFTRQISVSTVTTGTKKVESKIIWQQNEQRPGSITLTSYLTDWRSPLAPGRGGILVYGNGGTTTDAIAYRTLDINGVWGAAQSAADVDLTSTNRALRAARIYASSTRNEKILISRHFNGTTQSIYGQVFNGSEWGNVLLLASWNATTFLDVKNFSGTYLNNGDFMVIYADNTNLPKFRVWDGASWSGQVSLPGIGGIPNYIIAKNRPNTNEVMAAFFDQRSDTNSAYFNGGTYITSNWTLHAEHASAAPTNTKQFVDFDWSPNNSLVGGLVYSDLRTDHALNIKIWTANGSGGGLWSATTNTANQASQLGAVAIAGVKGSDEFIGCDKDSAASPRIICYRSNFTPIWSNPTNQLIVTGTDSGIQKSYDLGIETLAGELALTVYSDTTNIPKFKKYTVSSASWDATASTINALGASLETVRLIPQADNDDIMIVMADTNQDLYSIVWDGTANTIYTSPTGKAFSLHGTNGSNDLDYWFDFAWDKF